MKTRTKVLAGLLAISLMAPLAACGSSSAGGDTIDVMTSMDTGSEQLKVLQSITDEFTKENPGAKFNLIARSTSYEQDLKVRLSANNAPDIFNTHGWSRDRYSNFLEDLSGRSWAKSLTDQANSSLRNDKDQLYALPLGQAVNGILYNKTVLDKAGVDSTKIANWDDFTAACEKVKAVGATCFGFSGKDNWWGGSLVDGMANGYYDNAQRKALQEGKFEVKDYQAMLDRVKSFVDKGFINADYVSATPDDMYRLMAQDKMAFNDLGLQFMTSVLSYNPKAQLGLMPLPGEKSDPYFTVGELAALGVSKTSKHKDMALKYLDYLAKPANMKKLTAAVGMPSAFTNVPSELGVVTDSYNYWTQQHPVTSETIFDRVYFPDGMWNTMITTADSIMTGQATPQQAAEQVKTKFDSLYQQTKK